MDYELIMLRNAKMIRHSMAQLKGEAERLALCSYDATHWRNGTMGQIKAINDINDRLDDCRCFCDVLAQALNSITAANRKLLIRVYVHGVPKEYICNKFGVSMSTLYRKLRYARGSLSRALSDMGCDSDWFYRSFGRYEWSRLSKG